MNEKLNMLLKAFNSLNLSLEENKVLKKEIAMELILSSFISFDYQVDDELRQLVNSESGAYVIFSCEKLANDYFTANSSKKHDLEKVAINMESFMIKSEW